MNKILKLSLVTLAIVAGTLLLMAGVGGTGPRYVGRFFGDGTGLSNSVDLVEGPNILITPGPGNRAYTIESTAAGAAGIFTNGIMGYGDEYRTNYVRISPSGVSLTGGGSFAGDGGGLTNVFTNIVDTLDGVDVTGFVALDPDGAAGWQLERAGNDVTLNDTVGGKEFRFTAGGQFQALTINGSMFGDGSGLSNVVARFVSAAAVSNLVNLASNRYIGSFTGSGTGLTNLPGIVSVLDFGADATGVADSTAAFQKANDAVATNAIFGAVAGGNVRVPVGNYTITGTVYPSNSVTFEGEGIYTYSTRLNHTADSPLFEIRGSRIGLKNMTLVGDNAVRQGTGVKIHNDSQMNRLELMRSYGFREGFLLTSTWINTLEQCFSERCVNGLVLSNTVNANLINGGTYGGSSSNGIVVDGWTSAVNNFLGVTVELNTGFGMYVTNARGPINIKGVYFENNAVDVYAKGQAAAVANLANLFRAIPRTKSDTLRIAGFKRPTGSQDCNAV